MLSEAALNDLYASASDNRWLARRMDRRAARDRAAGRAGPLAGLSYFAKDLFDVAGEPTVAASPGRTEAVPAQGDAHALACLREAGAILLGTTNMDSLAYGFVTSTEMYGTARNPHDPDRLCGGSSGGSAAAVAAGLVPFALGTDTSGSIRVPSALCGVPGLKPTFGRLSRSGILPLSPSLDHCGLLADTLDRLELVFGVLDEGNHTATPNHRPLPERGARELRYGLLGGHFAKAIQPAVREAINSVAAAVRAPNVETPGGRARAAAYILVAAEAARTHAEQIRSHRDALDPAVRDRLTAALLVPDGWIAEAKAVAAAYAAHFDALFRRFDIMLAPAVPCVAPRLEEAMGSMAGSDLPLRAALGLYTQPISLIGLPVLTLPLTTPEGLPTAVQIIGPPGSESTLFQAAREIAARCAPAPLAPLRQASSPLPTQSQDTGGPASS